MPDELLQMLDLISCILLIFISKSYSYDSKTAIGAFRFIKQIKSLDPKDHDQDQAWNDESANAFKYICSLFGSMEFRLFRVELKIGSKRAKLKPGLNLVNVNSSF